MTANRPIIVANIDHFSCRAGPLPTSPRAASSFAKFGRLENLLS